MSNINREKLLEIFEAERDKAIGWYKDCFEYNSTQIMVSQQAVLNWNKAISLVKGMESELSCEDCQRLGGVM